MYWLPELMLCGSLPILARTDWAVRHQAEGGAGIDQTEGGHQPHGDSQQLSQTMRETVTATPGPTNSIYHIPYTEISRCLDEI